MDHNRKNKGFTAVASKPTSNFFSINYANIEGVSSNINAVHQHLQMERPHILALTETQVGPDTNHIHLECPGYDLNSRFRHQGGLCVYARDDISCQRRATLEPRNFDVMCFKITSKQRT